MDRLAVWLREVIALLFLVTVIESLVPLRVTRGYVRLATGLLLVIAFLRPLVPLAGDAGWVDRWQEGSFSADVPRIPDAAQLEEVQRRRTAELYRQALEGEAKRVLGGVSGAEGATVRVTIESDPRAANFGELSRITVELEGGSEAAEPARTALAIHFRLAGDDVKVVTRR